MNPRTESVLDWLLDKPSRIFWSIVVVVLAMTTILVAGTGPNKPAYQRMAEQTIIVQTGTTECHYVPAWEAISCVTLPRAYGPEAPTVMP